jgi:uncharacterized protein YodC (DUF2158 family)
LSGVPLPADRSDHRLIEHEDGMTVERFQMGDEVWLKIGGPRMIVGGQGQQEGGAIFHCYWAVGAEVRHMALPGGVLTKIEPRPAGLVGGVVAEPPPS